MNEDVPHTTPEPGEHYQRIPEEPAHQVVHLDWQHPQHKAWAAIRQRKGHELPFYIRTSRDWIGWVPWPGAKPAFRGELAWEMDLFVPDRAEPDLKGKRPK